MTPKPPPAADGPRSNPVDVAFPSADGTPLRAWYWSPAHPRAVLIISHGLGEHGGSYQRTADPLVESLDIAVLAFDYRASGRSPGKRGVIRGYADLSSDLEAANRWAAAERPGLPRFLLGHSNGGLIALRTLLDVDLGLAGLILSNPSLRVSARVPTWKRLVGEFLRLVAPGVTLRTGVDNEQLTHDRAVMAEIDADPLRHNRISPPLYFGMKGAGPIVLARASEIHLPTLLLLGGSDPIVDPEATRDFFQRLGSRDKTLHIYPEMRHEPLNEVGRAAVVADLTGWLEPRLPPRDLAGPPKASSTVDPSDH